VRGPHFDRPFLGQFFIIFADNLVVRVAETSIIHTYKKVEKLVVVVVSFVLKSVISRKVMVILQGLKACFDQNTLIGDSFVTALHLFSIEDKIARGWPRRAPSMYV
jgi:hypothetical protein